MIIPEPLLNLVIDILRAEKRPELFRFVDKCCLMSDRAELWLAMLKLYSNEKLDELGSVFVRAKAHLNAKEFEKLNQSWQCE